MSRKSPRRPRQSAPVRSTPPADADPSTPSLPGTPGIDAASEPPRERRYSRERAQLRHAAGHLRRSWLPEGLPARFRAQVLSAFDDELRQHQQANPELMKIARQVSDIGGGKSRRRRSSPRLGADVLSNVSIDGSQLRASVAAIMEFSHRVDGELIGRGAPLPHEGRFAGALGEAVREYRESDDAWRARERSGRLSRGLAALGIDEDTPARQAQTLVENFARLHGILPADAADAGDRVQRALRALSPDGPTAGGRQKASQRALAELLSAPGFKQRNIASDETLGGFEAARLTGRRPIEKPTTLEDVQDALERAARVARRTVISSAIDAGLDVSPLLQPATRDGDAELELLNRSSLAARGAAPQGAPIRGRLLPHKRS